MYSVCPSSETEAATFFYSVAFFSFLSFAGSFDTEKKNTQGAEPSFRLSHTEREMEIVAQKESV
jgi:hypothetical protein